MPVKYRLFANGLIPSLRNLTFLLILIIPEIHISAQDKSEGTEMPYGFDPFLYNGRYYTYKIPGNAKGNPFLSGAEYQKGSVTLMDKIYQDLELNYDVLNQALLMKYNNPDGSTLVIEIPESWLDRFTIGASEFELNRRTDARPAICQVIHSGPVKIQYFWSKDTKLDNALGSPVYVYSRPKRDQILQIKLKRFKYKNNREFINAFDPSIRINIRNYIRNKKINVRKASDPVISGLVGFCNSQINP
jgi:hypothetical protein